MNILLILLVALIPLIVGFLYYNEKAMGKAWMAASGMTHEKAQGANMPLIFGLTYLFSLMAAVALMVSVIHQTHIGSIFADMTKFPDQAKALADKAAFLNTYGGFYRNFGHGALHGFISSILFGIPLIGISALFERRSWKYIMIHWLYFAICFILMGGFICKYFTLS